MADPADNYPIGLRLRGQEEPDGVDLVSASLRGPARFAEARPGDHLMTPFQCDLCHFRNIYRRNPTGGSPEEDLFFTTIRRVILDAFWARASSTVQSNLQEMRRYIKLCTRVGAERPFDEGMERGPFPLRDSWGALVACTMLIRSLDEGRNSATVQFATVRRLRTAITNYGQTTPGASGPTTVAGDKQKQRFVNAPTTSLFFERFTQGCHNRMGDVLVQDQALTAEVLEALLDLLDTEYRNVEGDSRAQFGVSLLGAALTLGYSTALRGEEFRWCLLKETATESRESSAHPRTPHVMLAMRGIFKGTGLVKEHRFALVPISSSGLLKNQKWLVRLLLGYTRAGQALEGALFRGFPASRNPISVSELDVLFHEWLATLQAAAPEILSPRVDVEQAYSFRRSIRRGSTTHARNRHVPQDVIETNNRWQRETRAGNRVAQVSMLETYTDAVASLELNLRYSQSL